MNEAKEHKIAVLNSVNDSEVFLVITDKCFALGGEYKSLVAALTSAIIESPEMHGVVSDAITAVLVLKNSQ